MIRSASEEERIYTLAFQHSKRESPRDQRVSHSGHKLVVDGDRGYTTVSRFLNKIFGDFPEDRIAQALVDEGDPRYPNMTVAEIKAQWKAKGREAAVHGTRVHEGIEAYIRSGRNASKAGPDVHRGYLAFRREFSQLEPWFSEKVIFDEDSRLIARVDLVMFDREQNTFAVIEIKTNDKDLLESHSDGGEYASARLTAMSIADCLLLRATLQAETYRYIFNKCYPETPVAYSAILHLRDRDFQSANFDFVGCQDVPMDGFIADHKGQ